MNLSVIDWMVLAVGVALVAFLGARQAEAQVDSSGRFVGNAATANLGTGTVSSPNQRLQQVPGATIVLVCEREDEDARDIASGASVTFEAGGFWLVVASSPEGASPEGNDAVYVPERGDLCFPEAR